ncbi:MAG: PEP-CTERM sorting domain-containing protein [Verrucomicrobiota bacterium]
MKLILLTFRFYRSALVLLSASVGLMAAGSAVTFTNGSLEDLDSSYSGLVGSDLMENAAATGWSTWGSTSPDWVVADGPEGLYNTPYGDYFALAGATGAFDVGVYREGVSQTITGLVVDETYEVSFSHANGLRWNPQGVGFWEGVGFAGGWQVLVDSSSIGLVASTNDNGTPSAPWTVDWQSSSLTFTATATSHDIHFIAYKPDSPSQDPTFQFLDEVNVVVVPEPSVALLGCMGAGLALRRRRKSPVN